MKTLIVALSAFVMISSMPKAYSGSCMDEYQTKVQQMKKNQKWRKFGEVMVTTVGAGAGLAGPIAAVGAVGIIGGVLVGAATGGFSWATVLPMLERQHGIESSLVFMEQLYSDPAVVQAHLYEVHITKTMKTLNETLLGQRLPLMTRDQVRNHVGKVHITSLVDSLLKKTNKERVQAGKAALSYDEMKEILLKSEDSENYLCRHSWRGPIAYPIGRLLKRASAGLI